MKPLSDFTTPRRLIAPISRHFLPVEQPEPFCCTTGLKKGSRLPLIAHFFSSLGLGATAAGAFTATATGAGVAGAAILVTGEALACTLASALVAGPSAFAGILTTATLGVAPAFATAGCGAATAA